ncbi:MAG: Hg(II)-responsive transcriptional regulator [Pseudomonadota bacterium]|jgi:MerR family mercuric resistance operon transcriptional regulator
MATFTIAQLAQAAGVGVESIRFYQRKGLLETPPRPAQGIRRYGERDVARVRFIKSAQRIGFTLDEIAQLLKLDDGIHCAEARAIAERKLLEVRRRLHDLWRIEQALAELVIECGSRRGKVSCPVIARLQSEA